MSTCKSSENLVCDTKHELTQGLEPISVNALVMIQFMLTPQAKLSQPVSDVCDNYLIEKKLLINFIWHPLNLILHSTFSSSYSQHFLCQRQKIEF